MQESEWQALPFPLDQCASFTGLSKLDGDLVVERMLEDATGLAGVLAIATASAEAEERDVHYATRLLAEHLKALTVLWWQWREDQEAARRPAASRAPATDWEQDAGEMETN